jgi:hypothetical protein
LVSAGRIDVAKLFHQGSALAFRPEALGWRRRQREDRVIGGPRVVDASNSGQQVCSCQDVGRVIDTSNKEITLYPSE